MSSGEGSNFVTYSDDQSDKADYKSYSRKSPKCSRRKKSKDRKTTVDITCQTEFIENDAIDTKLRRRTNRSDTQARDDGIDEAYSRHRSAKYYDENDDNDEKYYNSENDISPVRRTRILSEQPRRQRADAVRPRARTLGTNKHGKQTKNSKAPANNQNPGNTAATTTVLSVRKIKIDDLRNELVDVKRQLQVEKEECNLLRAMYNKQQKELSRVEESRAEIPQLEHAHDEETRVVRTLMRKLQQKNRQLEEEVGNRGTELQRRFNTITSLKSTLQQKKKKESEAQKLIENLKLRIKKNDENIAMLKEKVTTAEKKITDDRKDHEADKQALKTLKKKYRELRKSSGELSILKQNAIQACLTSEDSDKKLVASPVKEEGLQSNYFKSQLKKVVADRTSRQNASPSGSTTPDACKLVSVSSLTKPEARSATFYNSQEYICREKEDHKPAESVQRSSGVNNSKSPENDKLVRKNNSGLFHVSSSSDIKSEMCGYEAAVRNRSISESSMNAHMRSKPRCTDDTVPIILPTSSQFNSVNESNSSHQGSTKDENCGDTNNKPNYTASMPSYSTLSTYRRNNKKI